MACEDAAMEDIQPVQIQNASFPAADERLWSYFQAFEKEAQDRGLDIDLVALNIEGLLENIPERNIAGTCSYGGNAPPEVTVDVNFWNNARFFAREMIVFHELGHCVLHRDHLEGRNDDGSCISIMRSGTQNCRDNYSSLSRDAYLDELFSTMR